MTRLSSTGVKLKYTDRSDAGIDQLESARDFLQSIEDYVHGKARALAVARERKGMPPEIFKDELTNLGDADRSSSSELFFIPAQEGR